MTDYPFSVGQMLFHSLFYLGGTLALFAVFALWNRSAECEDPRTRLFEALNIGGVAALFIALWLLCGVSSLQVEVIRLAIAPIVSAGFVLVLLSYLVRFKHLP